MLGAARTGKSHGQGAGGTPPGTPHDAAGSGRALRIADAHRLGPALPAHLFSKLCAHGTHRRVPKGAIVCHDGDTRDTFHVVRSGLLSMALATDDGRSVLIGEVGPGDCFGETIVDGGSREAPVLTLAPSEIVCLTRREFVELLSEDADFNKFILRKLAGRLRTLKALTHQLALMETDERIRALLDEAAQAEGALRVVEPPPTQQAIADRVGASRSMVNRVLKSFARAGEVELGEARWILHDRPSAGPARPAAARRTV